MYESDDRMVSHPDHYQSKSGLEVIDVIEAFTEDLNGIEATDTGNIIKYACRWKNKNGIQDLKKIMWYTQHLIDHLVGKAHMNSQLTETDYGLDVYMKSICGCPDILGNNWTTRDCECNCPKYYRCQNIALANGILAYYEEKETGNNE